MFIISQMLNHCAFFTLGFLFYTILRAIEMSKNETIVTQKVAVKLHLSLHARQGFWNFLVFKSPVLKILRDNFKFFLLLYLANGLCKSWIIFQKASVLLRFSKFKSLVFCLPCFIWTKIYANRPIQTNDSTNLFPVWR